MSELPDRADRFVSGNDEKRYRIGTHRVRTPDETVRLLEPLLDGFGITRVADVTGLDRLGIPVFMAMRPNSRSLAVSQGKGLDTDSARASAVMESIELHHAENIASPVILRSYVELLATSRVADPDALPQVRDSGFSAHCRIPWIEGVDLFTGESVWVPFELCHADTTVPVMPGSGYFERGTNGLASGNTSAEAALHGLCEVVERDACSLWEHATLDRQEEARIDLRTIRSRCVLDVLDRFDRAGVRTQIWDVTSDLGVPTFRAIIYDEATDPILNPMGAAYGAGCHPDVEVALCRALSEAAQSRLTSIAGSRDDLARDSYGAALAESAMSDHDELGVRGNGSSDVSQRHSLATPTVSGDVRSVLARLQQAGVEQAILIDLSDANGETPISVVRVIIPGLEGPTDAAGYQPGPRARAVADA
jgi:ribosomal protein S12 methylthiotransferase accessory factor